MTVLMCKIIQGDSTKSEHVNMTKDLNICFRELTHLKEKRETRNYKKWQRDKWDTIQSEMVFSAPGINQSERRS